MPRRTNGTTEGETAVVLPDLLGEDGRSRVIAQTLANLQEQRFRLEVQQVSNAHTDSDALPGGGVDKDGKIITYARRKEVLAQAEERLHDAYEPLMGAVNQLLDKAEAG
jgi:hypothetical protein